MKTKLNLLGTSLNQNVKNSQITYFLTMRKIAICKKSYFWLYFVSAANVHLTELRFEFKQQKNLATANAYMLEFFPAGTSFSSLTGFSNPDIWQRSGSIIEGDHA